jgi:hypothetical protein
MDKKETRAPNKETRVPGPLCIRHHQSYSNTSIQFDLEVVVEDPAGAIPDAFDGINGKERDRLSFNNKSIGPFICTRTAGEPAESIISTGTGRRRSFRFDHE